ncbi:polypeptide N-acetylgalactosaminyltransferase 5-like isoform X1 [Leptotrombidium deliense]|uniref:Polypeptide N-acetylgalactosaminyltransferase n=1 Tax=Leptotrombidium deliense TaxID=299467 RepID=A0A443SSA1_9ACAR|nr:polypeptide N-acetylgalactosaminyltransferase 5-like isoform X1 [Leptotrombidium deliense]
MVEKQWNGCVNPYEAKGTFLIVLYVVFLFAALYYSFSLVTQIDFIEIHYNESSLLPPYRKSQLQYWEEPVIKRNRQNAAGELGSAVDVEMERDGQFTLMFNRHKFNLVASDKVWLNRTLKDNRFRQCLKKAYPQKLPTASVIIVFHNEAFSTLIRTVQSVVQTSPKELLKEVILIDDNSFKPSLKYHLKHFVQQFSVPVRVVRLSIRSGLIKGRNFASRIASGDVLVFLDSHCECNEGWLTPLLARISEDRTRVVSPIRDVIDKNTFEYRAVSDEIFGAFDWKLRFRWHRLPKRLLKLKEKDRTLPIMSPVPNGGIFAIDKQFFNYFEKYDDELSYFGSEAVDLGLAVSISDAWTCGGSVEIIPCSRVGHVFRESIPYSFPGSLKTIMWYNAARILETWMDDHRLFFYNLFPDALRKSRGDTKHRFEMREKLKCHDFNWYLENIFPESSFPLKYRYLGQIEHIQTRYCMDTMYSLLSNNEEIRLRYCILDTDGTQFTYSQQFVYTENDEIQSDGECLDVNEQKIVVLRQCQRTASQKWFHTRTSQIIRHKISGLCLQLNETQLAVPTLSECTRDNKHQKWFMTDNFQWEPSFHKKHD